MVYRVKQPLASGVGGCAACCWRLLSATCSDVLRINMEWDGIPSGFIQAAVNLSGRAWVDGNGLCSSDTYVSVISGGSPYYQFSIDVWGAMRDGVWTSSTTIQIAGRQTAPFNTIAFGPEQDTGLTCWTSGFTYVGVLSACGAPTVVATITIMDDGTLSIV